MASQKDQTKRMPTACPRGPAAILATLGTYEQSLHDLNTPPSLSVPQLTLSYTVAHVKAGTKIGAILFPSPSPTLHGRTLHPAASARGVKDYPVTIIIRPDELDDPEMAVSILRRIAAEIESDPRRFQKAEE